MHARVCVCVCACVHLVRLCLQVFEVLLGSGQTPVVGHVLLHHVVVGMLQQEGVGSRDGLGQFVRLVEIKKKRKKKCFFKNILYLKTTTTITLIVMIVNIVNIHE